MFEENNTAQVMEIATGSRLTRTNPVPFFNQNVQFTLDPGRARDYDVTRDGGRLLTPIPPDAATALDIGGAQQIKIVLNWIEELKERVPVP